MVLGSKLSLRFKHRLNKCNFLRTKSYDQITLYLFLNKLQTDNNWIDSFQEKDTQKRLQKHDFTTKYLKVLIPFFRNLNMSKKF